MKVAVPYQKSYQGKKKTTRLLPPWFLEGGLYISMFYSLVLGQFGIIVPRLGIIFLAGLAGLCFLFFRERPSVLFQLLAFPIGLTLSFTLIQYMYHGISIMNDSYVKSFIPWIFTVIVVQVLCFRKGFLHRYAVFSLVIGMVLLPFLDVRGYGTYGDDLTRVALEKGMGPLSNPNGLGGWFGFCAVYFFVYGVGCQRQKIRLLAWGIAIGCLFIVTLTVSRGALVATVLGIFLASREFLKRGFIPIFLLIMTLGIAFGSGLFDQAIRFYGMRGTEESGRLLTWPLVFKSIIDAPLTGVGASNVDIFIPEIAKALTPHNSFLFVAMAGGIIPLFFYVAYWNQVFWAAFLKPRNGIKIYASFTLPLVVFSFMDSFLSNISFMNSYVIVSLCIALVAHIKNRQSQLLPTYKKNNNLK